MTIFVRKVVLSEYIPPPNHFTLNKLHIYYNPHTKMVLVIHELIYFDNFV